MPRFNYIAVDARGLETTGLVEALSSEQAIKQLKARGLFPTDVASAAAFQGNDRTPGQRIGLQMRLSLSFVPPVSARETAIFTRQLATLLRAGMPLVKGLEVLARQERNGAFRTIIPALTDDIRSGGTLSDALTRHPRVFDRLYLSMVRAGEAGGVLDVVLDRLAKFAEKSLQLRGKVRAAMVYPLIVLLVAVTILVGLLVFVVPRFRQIFADLLKGAPLPPLTQAVLAVSDAVRTHYLGTLAVLAVAWVAFNWFRRSPRGGRLVAGWVLRAPLFGDLWLKSIVARFSRTLGTLLSSGVPILSALLITRDTCGNLRVSDAIQLVHDRVKEGAPVARPLEGAQVFPPMVASMIEVGEHTGQLPEMLGKIADIYDDEVDNAVAGLSSLIEPILIVILAGVVGLIVVALFLPIIRIVQLLT
ncbi:MAG: type II secretion system F family protein [Opitutae bacterium]|nr:type II secretion system F family protein [Opitutae bacterium]